MGFCHWKNLFAFLFIFSSLDSHQQLLAAAMRPLEGEQWLKKDGRLGLGLALQALQRAPVPPVGTGNPCTNIPGQGPGTCTLTGMNIAGFVVARAPPVIPHLTLKVGDASTRVAINNKIHES